jgi:Tfp pilus assembly protein PilF
MKKYQKILLSAVILITLYCISMFVSFAFSGRNDARNLEEAHRGFDAGQFDRARPVLLKILNDDPANETACRLLAEIFESDRNFPVAAMLYQRAVSLSPFDAPLRSRLAVMLSATGRFDDLLSLLEPDFTQKTLGLEDLLCYLEALAMTGNRKGFEENLPELGADSSPRRQLLEGIRLLDQKDYASALDRLDRASTDPVSVSIRYKALSLGAIAAAMLKNEALAEARLTAAAELVPISGTYPLATFYLNRNDTLNASVWLTKCLEADPGQVAARLDLIDIYASAKEIDLLRGMLRFAPRSRDGQECLNYLKAAVALGEKNYAQVPLLLDAAPHLINRPGYHVLCLDARVALSDVNRIPEHVAALTRLSTAEQVRPQLAQKLYPLLVDLVRQEKFAEADTIAAVLRPLMSPAQFTAAVPTFQMLLLSAMKRNDYRTAMEYSAALLQDDPGMPLANLALGEALIAMKRPDQALVYLNAAPDSLSVLYDRAQAYTQLKDVQRAGEVYRAAWKQFPGEVLLFSAYADFLFVQQQFDELDALIAGMPDSPGANYAVRMIQAKIADRAGDAPGAARLYSEALDVLKTLPASDENLYRQAYLYALTGQEARAVPIYRALLQKEPNSMIILLNLSEVEATLGHHPEALSLAETAVRLYPAAQEVQDCLRRRKAETLAATPGSGS